MIGLGTTLNVATILVGSGVGMSLGSKIPERVTSVVTDSLGLLTLSLAMLNIFVVTDAALTQRVGKSGMLIVLGAIVGGAIIGSLLRLHERLESLGGTVHRLLARPGHSDQERFIDGWLTASLIFCIGPLTILGSFEDGMGRGISTLAIKSTLDGFAALAFATTFGVGVMASALSVLVVQGSLTALGWALGGVLDDAQIAALTATGGVMLLGLSLRLLRIREISVADLLPALLIAPIVVGLF